MDRSREDEYAEVYRRAYERARRGFEPTVQLGPEGPMEVSPDAPDRRRLAALALGAAALALVGGAFGIGRMIADAGPAVQSGAAAAGHDTDQAPEQERAGYRGAVSTVPVVGAEASCQSPSSVDAAGNPVGYAPSRAHDQDLSTAWRCNGDGRGERLTLDLPSGTRVAEVGLVPGYAKTDPADGTDRYAQNNRITEVRWHFDDGSAHVLRMDGDPGNRSMRTLRIPVTRTSTVVLEILRSQQGSRNTIAVSEVRVASPAR